LSQAQYTAAQMTIICAELFLIAVAAVTRHPQWFG
jgi:hypothetical protein